MSKLTPSQIETIEAVKRNFLQVAGFRNDPATLANEIIKICEDGVVVMTLSGNHSVMGHHYITVFIGKRGGKRFMKYDRKTDKYVYYTKMIEISLALHSC